MEPVRFKASKIELRDNNLIAIIPDEDDIYNGADIVDLLDICLELSRGKRFRLMMMLDKSQIILTKDARDMFKYNLKAKESIIAEAIVTKSRSTLILFNLILRLYSPPFPFKALSNEEAATKWLNSHK